MTEDMARRILEVIGLEAGTGNIDLTLSYVGQLKVRRIRSTPYSMDASDPMKR